jgi:hypothetical protein
MMIRKHSLALISIFAVFGVIPGEADDVLPPRFNFDRYSAMVKGSPFAIATAVALPAAPPNFAKDLYVANAAHSPEGDMVTIASSSDQNFKKYLSTREPVEGYGIASIEWSERVGATKVTISKDGNFATLTFNQALLSQASPGGGVAARPLPAPAVPVPNPGGVPKAHAPKLPPNVPPELQQVIPSRDSMQPRTRGMIQRSPRTTRGSAGGTDPATKQ